jgi:hypothetical protein
VRTTLRAVEADGAVRVNLLLSGARLEACRAWQPGVELLACAGALLQNLRGSAPALTGATDSAVWLPGASVSALVKSVARGRVRAWGALQLDARYHEVTYKVDERGAIGTFARFSVALLAGPEVRF